MGQRDVILLKRGDFTASHSDPLVLVGRGIVHSKQKLVQCHAPRCIELKTLHVLQELAAQMLIQRHKFWHFTPLQARTLGCSVRCMTVWRSSFWT